LVDEPRGFAESVRDANLVAPLTFRYHLQIAGSNLDGIVDKIDELCLSSLALHAEMNIWSSFAHQLPVYLHEYGAFVLFAIIMFEAGGLPLPGETALVTASALAASGDLNILHVTLAAIGGAVVGDNVGYAVGRYAGRTAVVKLFTRFGVAQRKLELSEATLRKHGMPLVAGARFLPVLRQLGGIGAGSIGMTWPRFLIANTTGAVCWVGFWLGAVRVFELGIHAHLMQWTGSPVHKFLLACSALVLLLAAVLVGKEIHRRWRGG
jgi:membrane protein DedA with SNARE-associated domain